MQVYQEIDRSPNQLCFLPKHESWEEAIKKYPSFTSKEKLEPFFGLTFRPGKMPLSFVKLTFNHEQNVLKFTSAAVIALFCQALTFGNFKKILSTAQV